MNTYLLRKLLPGILILTAISAGQYSCTDVQDDGINTVIWNGSVLPEDSCYRNPVWEPDLSYPSVFKAAVGYFAVGADNEWSPGLNYTAPVLSSNDLMNWRLRGQAFTQKPGWAEEKISSLSAGFAKTRGMYYIFYALGNDKIGMGSSRAPQGPFTDFGFLLGAESLGLAETSNPFFFPFGSKAYLFFQGGDGVYGIEVKLNKDEIGTLDGEMFKITGQNITSINMMRWNNVYYLLGAVNNGNDSKITISRSINIEGPYVDKDGNSLMNGEGTPIMTGSADEGYVAVNHAGGIFEDANGDIWLLYHATNIDKPVLSSGKDRHPMLLSRIEFDENGWPVELVRTKAGWNYPKFAK